MRIFAIPFSSGPFTTDAIVGCARDRSTPGGRIGIADLHAQLAKLPRVDGTRRSVIRSAAFCVLGKAMQSRMLSKPPNSITQRSMPSAMPPCGGAPKRSASSKKPNRSRACSRVDAQQAEHLLLHVLDRESGSCRRRPPSR